MALFTVYTRLYLRSLLEQPQQPGAKHSKNSGDGSGLQEKLPSPSSTLDRTARAVEFHKFLGTTIIKDLKWDCNISSIIKKAQQRMSFVCQLELMVQTAAYHQVCREDH
ncbi:hypothetical protein NFI96_030970 [Prochilodus magdalenae]|nr:hypothetical protein NFI96_030970 [Prochilodus magdalenae]